MRKLSKKLRRILHSHFTYEIPRSAEVYQCKIISYALPIGEKREVFFFLLYVKRSAVAFGR